MGRLRDKHGYINKEDRQSDRGTEICERCGRKFQDRLAHDAAFHPVYRDGADPQARSKRKGPLKYREDKAQTSLLYPDTAETGDTYNAEDRS